MTTQPDHRRLSLTLAAALACVSCQGTRTQPLREEDYPGTLQPASALPVQAVWQQHVTASWRGPNGQPQERGFDAAIQRRGDELTVVGLSPVGSVGFSITQRPGSVDVVNHIPEQMVIPPRFILLDVQRAFFPWTTADADADRRGEVVTNRDQEQIRERWEQGHLVERTFTRESGVPEGEIHVAYDWGRGQWALPERVVLDNGWFGYRLTIVTSSETHLDDGGRP